MFRRLIIAVVFRRPIIAVVFRRLIIVVVFRRLIIAVVLLSLGYSSLATATDTVSNAQDSTALVSNSLVSNSRFTYVFPFSNVPVSYSRDHLNYPATDVSGCYAHILAPTSGIVFDVETQDLWNEELNLVGTRGGLTITIHGDDNVRYYFAHLGRVKVKRGDVVAPGQWIGVIGSSGNARITICHTHLGISRICPRGEIKVLQGEIWPWRFLDAWRKGINKSPIAAKNRVIKKDPTACENAYEHEQN